MPSTIYTISSGESDDDDNNISPRQDVNKSRTQLKNFESSPETQINKPKPIMDAMMSNEDNLCNFGGDHASDVVDKIDLSASEDSSSSNVENLINNAKKRKSSDKTKGKGKKKKTLNAASQSQTKKQKLAEEQAAKKIAAELNKMYKTGECMKVKLSASREACSHALYVAEAGELSSLVASHSLSSHLAQLRALCGCSLTLLVFQPHDYFKAPRRKTSNSNRVPMTEIEFELAITDLLVSADCDTIIANSASELTAAVMQITKAIAEAPAKKAKRACDEEAAFYMRGDNRKCVVVDKDGVGVGRLWQQMLAVLPQSSLRAARALAARYDSPRALYESLQSPGSIATVADIDVAHSSRRVGAQLACKLHTLLTATHGDQLIQ